jgi:hypothetical protein
MVGGAMTWTLDIMRPLVHRFDDRVRGDMSRFDRLREPAHSRGTVLREPATEAGIIEAEQRLGVKLPPSYRAFLLVTDGAYASSLGAETQQRGENQWRHGLLRVSDVGLTVNADPIGVRIWCDEGGELVNPGEAIRPTAQEPQSVADYKPYREGLVITHIHNGTDRLALVPRPGREEWELWDFHHVGATAHASFGDFLRWFTTRPDRRPKPEDADALVEEYVSGRRYTLNDLAELGDPRAEEFARRSVETGRPQLVAIQLLGKLGNQANIPLLLDLYWKSLGAVRAQTLMALDELDAPDLDDLLRDALASDDESLRSWARWRFNSGERGS